MSRLLVMILKRFSGHFKSRWQTADGSRQEAGGRGSRQEAGGRRRRQTAGGRRQEAERRQQDGTWLRHCRLPPALSPPAVCRLPPAYCRLPPAVCLPALMILAFVT